jgi:hypothetical protein
MRRGAGLRWWRSLLLFHATAQRRLGPPGGLGPAVETNRRQDGEVLGAKKVGEGCSESDITELLLFLN